MFLNLRKYFQLFYFIIERHLEICFNQMTIQIILKKKWGFKVEKALKLD